MQNDMESNLTTDDGRLASEALAVATEAGHILLENGAEISRVEETMERISSHYGVNSSNFFVLSNGIFTTGSSFANVEYIPFKGTQLDKVVAVNQLSRDIEHGRYTLAEAHTRLQAIRHMPARPFWEQVIASAIGSAAFCIIFGGGLADSAVAFVAGLLLYMFVLGITAPRLSKIFSNICGGAVVTLVCLLAHRLGFGHNLSNILVGAVIPLVPGVPFTNGIRDIANEDYIAGITRLLDAMMVFVCIALGVSLTFFLSSRITGYAEPLPGMAVDTVTARWLVQLAAAGIGTSAFAVLFGVPRRHYALCGVVGLAGWLVYLLMTRCAGSSVVMASCVATIAVALLSRGCAIWKKCVVTVFLICGIFPLVPGGGIFWTAFHTISGHLGMALTTGFTAIKVTVAIILGIVFVTEIPFRISRHIRRKLKAKRNGN